MSDADNFSNGRPPELPVEILSAVGYIDRIGFSSLRGISAAERRQFQPSVHGTIPPSSKFPGQDKHHQGGKRGSSWKLSSICQPTLEGIRLFQQLFDDRKAESAVADRERPRDEHSYSAPALSVIEYACDLICGSKSDSELLARWFMQRWVWQTVHDDGFTPFKHADGDDAHAAYFAGGSWNTIVPVIYGDRPSKPDGRFATHLEIRILGPRSCRRLGLETPFDAFELDPAEQVCKRMRLYEVDVEAVASSARRALRKSELQHGRKPPPPLHRNELQSRGQQIVCNANHSAFVDDRGCDPATPIASVLRNHARLRGWSLCFLRRIPNPIDRLLRAAIVKG